VAVNLAGIDRMDSLLLGELIRPTDFLWVHAEEWEGLQTF
jgi:hypothetical protein